MLNRAWPRLNKSFVNFGIRFVTDLYSFANVFLLRTVLSSEGSPLTNPTTPIIIILARTDKPKLKKKKKKNDCRC